MHLRGDATLKIPSQGGMTHPFNPLGHLPGCVQPASAVDLECSAVSVQLKVLLGCRSLRAPLSCHRLWCIVPSSLQALVWVRTLRKERG